MQCLRRVNNIRRVPWQFTLSRLYSNYNNQASKQIPSLPLFSKALELRNKTAIISQKGQRYSYEQLLQDSDVIADRIRETLKVKSLEGRRVSFLFPNGYEYVATQWAVWKLGGVAVPLCNTHPLPEVEYVVSDSQSSLVIAHRTFEEFTRPLFEKHQSSTAENGGFKTMIVDDISAVDSNSLSTQLYNSVSVDTYQNAMLIYTSGTTGRPKGVVSTHRILEAQATSLIEAWQWTAQDHVLHVLPLHHLHGVLNLLLCSMWSGATCEFMKFDARKVWQRFAKSAADRDSLNLFMAVPTVYDKLIHAWETATPEEREVFSASAAKFRLMVSGSSALPVPLFEKWREITGHVLLERFGMTEIGMALSNPLHPVEGRIPGTVGKPLPGVKVRIVNETTREDVEVGQSGELLVSGPNVFKEYWNKPEATKKEFEGEWFKTGDIAVCDEHGVYKILGRSSVDILKSGGYKLSALDIERVLLSHPLIAEVAIVGVADEQWGQRVACVAALKHDATAQQKADFTLESLRAWCKSNMADYKAPTLLKVVDAIPRNAMGKVNKKELVKIFNSDQ